MSQRIPLRVVGEPDLVDFRSGLTGANALELLAEAKGRLLAQLPVGVGKTEWIVQIVGHVLANKLYDTLLLLVPRWDVLYEVRERLSDVVKPILIRPRPKRRCGSLNEHWEELERLGCGALGRDTLCRNCPRRKGCPWPGQYGKRLRGAKLVLATQQNLIAIPQFVKLVRLATGANSILTLVDESDLLLKAARRTITPKELSEFTDAVISVDADNSSAHAAHWTTTVELFQGADTADLRAPGWRFRRPNPKWALQVQQCGRQLFGGGFRFLGDDLHQFARSDPASRERLPDGTTQFSLTPSLGKEFIIFSGSMARGLARYRLDPNHAHDPLVSPFANVQFSHPGSHWFNIPSALGSAKYFPKNAPQLLDFFARLVARNMAAGERTLLVARKKFVHRCQREMQRRLRDLGRTNAQVVAGDWKKHKLDDPNVVALITYGMMGVNRFEHVEHVYCLTGYFVPAAALEALLNDLEPTVDHHGVAVEPVGQPPRRRLRLQKPRDGESVLDHVADEVLVQKEADVIVQAVGRVRPFTRPREVVTVHMGELPGVTFTREFTNLADARAHFQLPTACQAAIHDKAAEAARMKALGRSNKEIAAALKVSIPTVKRYVRMARDQNAYS